MAVDVGGDGGGGLGFEGWAGGGAEDGVEGWVVGGEVDGADLGHGFVCCLGDVGGIIYCGLRFLVGYVYVDTSLWRVGRCMATMIRGERLEKVVVD